MSRNQDDPSNYDPGYGPPSDVPYQEPTGQKRYNTTPNWQDPLNPPQPQDPYYAEWRAANPGIPESAAEPVGPQLNLPKPNDPAKDPPPPPTTPDPNNGPYTKRFDGRFAPPTPTDLGGPLGLPQTPTLTGPAFPSIPRFQAPTAQDAMTDPGYEFVRNQGRDSLQNWAAARGTLNDSSTAKALEDYGQSAATQQYANVWNRNYQTYNTDVENQYLKPWQAQYQNWATGVVNPAMTAYTTQAGAQQHGNDVNYLNKWNEFLNSQNEFNSWQDRAFNKQWTVANG